VAGDAAGRLGARADGDAREIARRDALKPRVPALPGVETASGAPMLLTFVQATTTRPMQHPIDDTEQRKDPIHHGDAGLPVDQAPGGARATDSIPEPPAADPAPDLADLLKRAETEVADLKDAWLRARADVENLRRQSAQDVAKAHKFAVERLAADLLPVKDALEQALAVENATLEQLRAGVELTLKQLNAAFGRAQLSEIDPKTGEKFDPHRHQAMQMVASDHPANTIAQLFQKGYMLYDRVLRPALVAVAKDD
jgi:molecular chaperone GrpE